MITDFGGVLTSPLVNAFLDYQTSTGIAPEDFGAALGALAARDGANPLHELESGRITEARFLSDVGSADSGARARDHAARLRNRLRRRACARTNR